jgi:hypothetical protein
MASISGPGLALVLLLVLPQSICDERPGRFRSLQQLNNGENRA